MPLTFLMIFVYKVKFIMQSELWDKSVVFEVELNETDCCDWIQSLPLIFQAKWNHYIGFYYNLIEEFYQPYQPFPYLNDYFWLELAQNHTPINGSDIVSHLFTLYSLPSQPLRLICHFRRAELIPKIDLKTHFKNTLKASTCIRYGNFGSSVITVEMSVCNIDDMFNNFQNSQFQEYLGETDQQSIKLGYKFIVENKQKIKKIPVKFIGKGFIIERGVNKQSLLSELLTELLGNQQPSKLAKLIRLHGVVLPITNISFERLEKYCHPDGYLYFTF